VSAVDPIHVEGLKEFRDTLRKMGTGIHKSMKDVLNAAVEVIAVDARRRVPTRRGKAKQSIRTQSSQLQARVLGGGKRVPYYPWLDFGGKVGRNKSIHRPFLQEGRYLYPAYRKHKDDVKDLLQSGLVDLARDAGFEVQD
jgi:hypothetical protein